MWIPTKRYQLGELLSGITRHFLLMTATPHNGKEEDFQLLDLGDVTATHGMEMYIPLWLNPRTKRGKERAAFSS